MFDRAIQINPNDSDAYKKKGNYKINFSGDALDSFEAIKMYDIAL